MKSTLLHDFCILFVVCVGLVYLCHGKYVEENTVIQNVQPVNYESIHTGDTIVKTVAHIPLENDNMILLHSNVETDTAIYVNTSELPMLNIGDSVYTIRSEKCSVVAADATGFVISDNNVLYPGCSGQSILNANGDCVGYVSERQIDGNVRCIWN